MIWTWQSVEPAKLSAALPSLIASPAAEPSARSPNSRRVKPMVFPPSFLPHEQFQRRSQSRGYNHYARHRHDAGGESAGRILAHTHHIRADEAAKRSDGIDEGKAGGSAGAGEDARRDRPENASGGWHADKGQRQSDQRHHQGGGEQIGREP